MDITNGDMPTVVLDVTGNLPVINNGFRYLVHGGRYVLIGLQKEDIHFSDAEFHKREATLMSSRNALQAGFKHVMAAMKKKKILPSAYFTHRVEFKAVKDNFESWLNPANGVIKATIEL